MVSNIIKCVEITDECTCFSLALLHWFDSSTYIIYVRAVWHPDSNTIHSFAIWIHTHRSNFVVFGSIPSSKQNAEIIVVNKRDDPTVGNHPISSLSELGNNTAWFLFKLSFHSRYTQIFPGSHFLYLGSFQS